jgi:hypothetical protein
MSQWKSLSFLNFFPEKTIGHKIICVSIKIKRKHGRTPLTTGKRGESSLFYLSFDLGPPSPHLPASEHGLASICYRVEREERRWGRAVSADGRGGEVKGSKYDDSKNSGPLTIYSLYKHKVLLTWTDAVELIMKACISRSFNVSITSWPVSLIPGHGGNGFLCAKNQRRKKERNCLLGFEKKTGKGDRDTL